MTFLATELYVSLRKNKSKQICGSDIFIPGQHFLLKIAIKPCDKQKRNEEHNWPSLETIFVKFCEIYSWKSDGPFAFEASKASKILRRKKITIQWKIMSNRSKITEFVKDYQWYEVLGKFFLKEKSKKCRERYLDAAKVIKGKIKPPLRFYVKSILANLICKNDGHLVRCQSVKESKNCSFYVKSILTNLESWKQAI